MREKPRDIFWNNNKQQQLLKNDRAYPCNTLIITNVNGNNEENFTWFSITMPKIRKN